MRASVRGPAVLVLVWGVFGGVTMSGGCGSATPAPRAPAASAEASSPSEPTPVSDPSGESTVAESTVEESTVAESTVEEATVEEATPPQEPCARLGVGRCRMDAARCVWDDGACRDPVHACETVTPDPMWSGRPLFSYGDPCERVDPGCAWDPSTRRCAPFAPVPACPATLDDARAATVLCNHSGQPELACRYGRTRCLCEAPNYCGGAPPTPDMAPAPAVFSCIPPEDARGCPTGTIRNGAPCHLSASVECTSCRRIAQCIGGHWRVRMLPPMP